jgi:hypothetical protein
MPKFCTSIDIGFIVTCSDKLTIASSLNNQLFSGTAIVKIIQPSPRELICRKDGNIREVIFTIVKVTAIGFIFSLLLLSKQSFNPSLHSIFPIVAYPVFCFLWLTFTHDDIAIFNLDLQSVVIENHLILFNKRYSKKYDLSTIRNVYVEKNYQFIGYNIVLKQFNGRKDIYIPSSDSTNILIAEEAAQKIRDFLGLELYS